MTAERRTLVVVPALNEERSVGAVVESARRAGFPVCVISDGSLDATARVAREAGATVLELPLNLGVGGALRCGFRWALAQGYDVVVQVDGDGQHDPAAVTGLLETMDRRDADMVIGSRFVPGAEAYEVSRTRRLAMRALARRARRATGTPITDSTSGFRAIRRPLLDTFAADYPVEYLGDTVEALVLAGNSGAKVVERPIEMSPRWHGTGSAGLVASLWYIVRVLLAVGLMHRRRHVPPPSLPSDHGVVP